MSLPDEFIATCDMWLADSATGNNVVVSSRARYARNLRNHPFAPHASEQVLDAVRKDVFQAIEKGPGDGDYITIGMKDVSGTERAFLKESRLISREMERGGHYRYVLVNRRLKSSIMVNEEDHLRMQCLEPGFNVVAALDALTGLESALASQLEFAHDRRFGYLTACPTNVGTGLRISAMLHLPALTLRRSIESALQILPNYGLTVRGFYGENSDTIGDFYQISNEVTLGKSDRDIQQGLSEVVGSVIDRELEARSTLHKQAGAGFEDMIWRSYGILCNARKLDSAETMKLLSRVRLGIDADYFPGLTHEKLNRLIVDIQPGHLVQRRQAEDEPEARDKARATLVREFFKSLER